MQTAPERDKRAWFALADAESCRLLYGSLTEQGTHQVEETDAIKNTLPEPEHMRAQTNAGTTHDVEEKERRFASEIIAWVQKKAAHHGWDHLVIFAPPRMLGVLRTVRLGSLNGHVEELKGDFMRLTTGQLADHPMIRERVTLHLSEDATESESRAMSTPGIVAGGRADQPDWRCMTTR